MLELIDESLESFLRAVVPLSAADVDVSFEPPERTWSAKLNRPTVNLFLWDIKRSADRARAGVEQFERDGVLMRRLVLPRVELRYLITAWTSEHADERALLGALLQSVLAYGAVPEEHVAAPLRDLSPLTFLLTRSGDAKMDVFKALEGQLKPALDLLIVTDVDTGLARPTAPGVSDVGVSVSDPDGGHRTAVRRVAGEVRVPGAAGCTVTSPRAVTTADPTGRFLIRAATGDVVTIGLDPPRDVVVPAVGGIVVG